MKKPWVNRPARDRTIAGLRNQLIKSSPVLHKNRKNERNFDALFLANFIERSEMISTSPDTTRKYTAQLA